MHNSLRIYLARHGQTEWNAQRRLQGGTDIPLNDAGIIQAHELAAKLRGIYFDRIYSSSLRRSRETAEIIAGETQIEILPGLNEQSFGIFEGQYLDGRDPAVVHAFERRIRNHDDTLDGGESVNRHFARVKTTVEKIRESRPYGQILIVGHGGTNALILRTLLNLTPEQTYSIHQDNTELYLIELFADRTPILWKHIPADDPWEFERQVSSEDSSRYSANQEEKK